MISIHGGRSSDLEVEDIEKQMAVPEEHGGMKVDEMNVTINANKKGGIIGGLLMKLLLKQMPAESIKAELEKMLGNADPMIKEKVMDKFDEILQMQTIGMESRLQNDPMLRGEMPIPDQPGMDQAQGQEMNQPQVQGRPAGGPATPSRDEYGREIDPSSALA